MDVVDIDSLLPAGLDGLFSDKFGFIGGIVKQLDFQQLFRIVDCGHGIHQAFDNIHLVVDGQLDGDSGKFRKFFRLGKLASCFSDRDKPIGNDASHRWLE